MCLQITDRMREEQLICCILREGNRFLKLFIHVVMKQELISFMYFFSLLYSFLFLFYFSFFLSAPSISYFFILSFFQFLLIFIVEIGFFKNKITTNERKAIVTSLLQSHKCSQFCCRSCDRTLHFPITSKNWYTIFQTQVYSFIALKQAIEKLIQRNLIQTFIVKSIIIFPLLNHCSYSS